MFSFYILKMNTTQFRPEFFSNFGWPDHLFYLQKPPPRNQMVVRKIRITVANYGQNNRTFGLFIPCWFFISFSDNSKCFHRNGFEMYILIIIYMFSLYIRVITKLPNSEKSNKGKVKTHKYINRQNQSTTGKLWKP